ncbi:cell division protein FtsQ [Paenibacillus sp. GCM10028914]|uniref:cell division protein FtsQ n=1 Tax=Paenibacillus sp. GCM10028914 TaxID=3273416 RepID=UPI00361BD7E7
MVRNSRVYTLTSSQKMMIFVLSMSLYGLSNMFTELIPSLKLGPIELSVEYFAFIPLTLCMLFHPFYAAVGAALGEIIFGELMLGQFGGLGELEKFLTFSFAMYVAGRIVKDPKNRAQVGIAAMTGVIIHQLCSSLVDIGKVWIGVEEFEAVPGLAQSVVLVEGVGFLNDVLFSGILFALLPTLYLVPRLYGKIEPLLGIKPRQKLTKYEAAGIISPKLIIIGIVLAIVAFGAESLSETDWNIGEWDSGFADRYGVSAIWISIAVAAVVAIAVLLLMRSKRNRSINKENTSGSLPHA